MNLVERSWDGVLILPILSHLETISFKHSYIYSDSFKPSYLFWTKPTYFLFNFFMFIYWIFTAPSFRYGIGIFLSFIYFGSFFTPKSPRYSYIINKNLFMFLMFLSLIFFNSLLIFFSTINVKPLKESLNCCVLIVGKKELKLSLLNSCLDLFKARGVKKVENVK